MKHIANNINRVCISLITITLSISSLTGYTQTTGQKSDTNIVYNFYKRGANLKAKKTDSVKIYVQYAIDYGEKHHVVSYGLAESYYLLGGIFYNGAKFQDALVNFENYRKIAEKIKRNDALFLALNAIANVYIEQGKPDVALTYYLKGLALATAINNKKNVGMAYNNIAFVYKDEGKYDEAISYLFKSVDVNESIGGKLALGNNYLQLTVIFLRRNDIPSAIKYDHLSLKIFEDLHRLDLMVTAHYMLSAAYESLHDLPKARAELDQSISINKQMNDPRGEAFNLGRLADLLYEGGEYKQALVSYKETVALMEKIKLQRGLSNTYISLGKTLSKLGDFSESEKYLKRGLDEAIKNNQAEVISAAHKELAILYHAMKKDSLAITYLSRHIVLKDSLISQQTSNKLSELETKYETEKKQKQIEELNHQTTLQTLNLKNKNLLLAQNKSEIEQKKLQVDNQQLQLNSTQVELTKSQLETLTKGQKITLLNNQNVIQQLEINKRNTTIMIIAALLILVLLIGYQLYGRYKLKQEAVLQAEVIRQQDMATRGIIEAEERERKRIAGELHDGVGQLFTTVKMNMEILIERFLIKQPDADLLAEKTMAMVDESCTEVRSIAHQMMPNALIKSGLVSALRDFINKIPSEKLKISMEVKGIGKEIEHTTETVLYRVIQESVNNVIKHAEATALDILLLGDAKEITVSIEDNGKGFNTADNNKFNGIGLKNMISRVEYLKGTVDISSSPGKGTLVAIFIPVI